MARTKKSEVVEEVQDVVAEPIEEAVVEEKPKAKRTRTKKVVEEVAEEPKVEEPATAAPVSVPYRAVVDVKYMLDIRRGPANTFVKVGSLAKGTNVLITDVIGNFGRIGNNKWININYIKKV